MRTALILSTLILLAACQPTPEQAAENERAKQAWLDDKCTSYGFKKGTKDFSVCKMQTEAAVMQNAAMQQQSNAVSSAAALQLMQAGQPRAPMTFNCTRTGTFTNCQGY